MKPYAGLLIFLFVASAGVCGEGRDFSGSVAGLPGGPAGLEAWELSDSLRFRPYSRHAHLTPEVPAFVKKSALERTYIDLLTERWSKAAGERTFEAKQMSLQDFSKIDIPVKFPKTIGRVIGQGANLSVSGSEQISFGGQSRYRVNEPMTEYGQRSKFPTLDMKQHLKIDLEGTVGEKIHVMVHHDSEIETPLENRIKLRYEGDDDEIVQSIEMGNTNLTLPGSQFVSYSGKQEGLFGAKMLAKLGALDVTAVASKQEGRTSSARFEANIRDSVELDDLDFVRNKYFFIIHPYQRNPGPDEDPNRFIDVEVYLDDGNGNNNDAAIHAYAFMDPTDETIPEPALWDNLDYAFDGKFDVLMLNTDYAVDQRTGEIALLTPLAATHTLAVRYIYGNASRADTVGGTVGDSLALKMIRPTDEEMKHRWGIWKDALRLERKNVYSLQTSYISEEKVEVTIYRKSSPIDEDIQHTYEYSKILGIDLADENGLVDTTSWVTDGFADGGRVNGELGLLLFPDLRPFDPEIVVSSRPEVLDSLNRNSVIYDEHYSTLVPAENYSKFYMVVRFTTVQTTFKLPNINILENSEVVTLNGQRLTRNVDYEIYYDIGQIRFKTEEATDPDARIAVDYQYVPFLSMSQQSLVGVQGIYRLGERSHIGAAWLYQSKKSPEERPRLGQEPSRIMMGDVNAQVNFAPQIMTTLVDALPMVEADKPSKLELAGELGMSFPNPNTKGDVYIDDMEGVKDLRSFSVLRESWLPASPPTGLRWQDTRRIWWYVKDREVKEEDLFTKAESRPGEAYIPVLEINFRDAMYGTALSNPDDAWAGLMRLVSRSGSDYSELRFVEVWLRQKPGHGGADSMHIDLGAVSENFYDPWAADSLHTEDKDKDGELSTEENTGLDGVKDGHPGDDPHDDWSYSEGDYSHINGTEGDPRYAPDTEDLDGDGNLDTDNIHFRLSFDLSDTTYIVSEATKGWRQYRLPLVDADTLGGSPSWRSIKYLRFFFTGVDSEAVLQIAYMQIAGASWLEEGIRTKETMLEADAPPEETFEISAKNTRDDPDYNPPYDPGKDPEGYRKREQSLVFSLKNLGAGHCGAVHKLIPGKASDYTLYKSLAFYAHADEAASSESLYVFVRIGSDSINFYEYGVRVAPTLQNAGSGWQKIEIPLDDITNLKGSDDTVRVNLYGSPTKVLLREKPLDSGDGWIAVYGAPSITRVSRIGTGVVNRRHDGTATSSKAIEIWFDDLRLTDVRKDVGFAKRLSVAASFSDVMNLNADYRHTDTEFQTLSANRRGSDDTDYSISGSTSLDRYLPDVGVSLPFSVRYHKNQSLPTLASNSDIALKPEERKEEERSSVDDSYRLSFSRSRKSKNILMRLTLDAISAGATYSRKRGISPEVIDRSSGYSGSISYNFSPWWTHTIKLYRGYKISYMPENVTVNVNGSTRTTTKVNRRRAVTTEDNKYTRDINGVFNISFKPLSGGAIQTDYSLKTTRDLDLYKYVPILTSIGWGRELTRSQRTGLRLTRDFGQWMRPTLSYDVNYDENADPKNRAQGEPVGIRRASVSSRSKVDVFLTVGSIFTQPAKRNDDTTGVPLTSLVLARIPDLEVSYVLDRNSTYNKLRGRPGLKYQLGIDPVAGEDLVFLSSSGGGQRTDDRTRKSGLNVGTEFEPISSISLDSKYRYDNTVKTYAGGTTYNRMSVWPDVTGNISSVASLSFFQGLFKSSSVAVGYKGTSQEDGKGSSTKTKEVHKSEWLPLLGWDATWMNGVRTTLNVRRSNSETENLLGTRSVQKTTTTVVNLSVRHSFSAPKGMYIPLAGRTVRFNSNLTLTVDMNYETSLTTTPTSRDRIDKNTRKFSVLPQASYSFSKSITGSANARFEQTSDLKRGETWRTIGISASVLIRF